MAVPVDGAVGDLGGGVVEEELEVDLGSVDRCKRLELPLPCELLARAAISQTWGSMCFFSIEVYADKSVDEEGAAGEAERCALRPDRRQGSVRSSLGGDGEREGGGRTNWGC